MIKALTGTSLIEYPGKISSIVFLSGCNLYCPFCHNPELVRTDILKDEYNLTHDQVLQDLKEREGFIEAVTVTGGEPLVYSMITELVRRIKFETGLFVKIDTNGTFPKRLKEISDYADFIAMDLKSSPDGYLKATGERAGFKDVEDSIHFILKLPRYEFRTTMVPGIVSRDDVVDLLEM
ncbi:MAG: anaerobic ribonucleoside-triphosphate reductase activating protein, partial [Candidatus Aegiribacteria sp.]|nr:anaerobic ribonucleoside-triphosphate reductase activating protein [Candidatus Aegiribacteria sp.]MBD3294240.1 anaerobic ribonucleoside-triphosphate reductase activating protein [Candidatus Fermentibacteria bacterium]